jgi:hypothetical protein
MATYTFTLQGTSPTTIDATDLIQFAGAAFGNALFVGNYNDTTHVETAAGANKSSGNTPHNTKFVDATHFILDGGASTLLTTLVPTTAQCPLKINFSHGVAVTITNHIIYAYNGATTTVAPTEVTFKIAEQGDTSWSTAGGSGAAMTVNDHLSANTSHDFYFLISASPTAVGLKTAFVIRDELIYS